MPRLTAVGWLLLAAVLARADDPPKAPPTPAEQFQALNKEYQEAMNAYQKAYSAAKNDEERQKAFEKYPQPATFSGRFLELAEKNPKDPVAVDALVWVVQRDRGNGPESNAGKALAILQRDHLSDPKIGPVCTSLTYSYDPGTVPFLRAVLEKNPGREAQGAACLTLARVLKSHAQIAARIRENPEEATRLEGFMGKETVAALKAKKPEEINAEVEKLFERVVKEYGDLKSGRGTFKEAAEGELFEIKFLTIGKPVPEITGEDIDGLALRLSDYRGKVVVLDFWGNW